MQMTTRKRMMIVIMGLVVLIGLGVFSWAVKTGKIRPLASTFVGQKVSGKVYVAGYSSSGAALANVKITDLTTGKTTWSAANGSYALSPLNEGKTTLKFEKDGTIFKPNFSDVPISYWAYKEIGAIKNAGITTGYSDGTFRPTQTVSRADMAIFVARALAKANGLSDVPNNPTGPHFSDVLAGHVAYKYVEYLRSQGVVSGYPDYTYHPDEIITRAQMAVYLVNALKLDLYTPFSTTFSDVSKSYWAFSQIETAAFWGIVSGYGNGTFRPEDQVTRDQMAVFLVRAFNNIKLTNGGYTPMIMRLNISGSRVRELNLALEPCGQVGRLTGRVLDQSSRPVAGAKVVLTLRPQFPQDFIATTDNDGRYNFSNIPFGTYADYVLKPNSSQAYTITNTNRIIINNVSVKTADLYLK